MSAPRLALHVTTTDDVVSSPPLRLEGHTSFAATTAIRTEGGTMIVAVLVQDADGAKAVRLSPKAARAFAAAIVAQAELAECGGLN